MATKFACHSIRLDIEDNNCPVNSSRSEKVPFAIEADASCMATSKTGTGGLGVVLREYKGVGEREIHFANYNVSAWYMAICLRGYEPTASQMTILTSEGVSRRSEVIPKRQG